MTQLANSALTETVVLAAPTVSGETDRQLLEQWVASRDVVALDAIVQRYAKLVYATCRRHSRSIQDAEDAVQATFLVLAAEAKRIRRRDALGAWLHTTAYRTAARIRAQTRAFELPADFAEPIDNVDQLAALCKRQHLRVLDEELAALSPQYRAPLVMHYLQECSVDEVAQRLSTTSGAVRGQLQRGRRELQSRLRQRGVELGAVLTLLANWQLESVRCPAAEFFRPLSDWIASAVQQPEVAAAIVSADPHPWPKVVSPPYRIGSLVMLSLSWFSFGGAVVSGVLLGLGMLNNGSPQQTNAPEPETPGLVQVAAVPRTENPIESVTEDSVGINAQLGAGFGGSASGVPVNPNRTMRKSSGTGAPVASDQNPLSGGGGGSAGAMSEVSGGGDMGATGGGMGGMGGGAMGGMDGGMGGMGGGMGGMGGGMGGMGGGMGGMGGGMRGMGGGMGGMVGGAMGGWSTAPKNALPELEQRLNSLLVTPVKLPLNDDMSVREALVSISKEIGLPVIFSPDVDERMLERKLDRSYDAEFPVASLLKMVLSDANLTYRREDGVVRIVMDYRNQGGNDDAIWIMQDQQTMSQISALLGEKIKGDLEFVAVPAREVVATLSRETSILIDLLPNDDWDWDEPITLTALSDTATVRDVIGMIDPNVSYTVKNGRLTLMSIDSANEMELHRIYWIDSFGPGSVDVLTNLIEQSIEPDSWLNQGGPSRIGTLVGGDGSRNGVMVTAPYSTHEQIEKLLQTLRESGFYSAQ